MAVWKKSCLACLLGLWFAACAGASPLSTSDLANVLPEWPVSKSEAGGRFILSDSPEDVRREGILYQDRVKGEVRLFFHHVNVMAEKKRIVAMLLNTGNQPARVEVHRYGVSRPDSDYLRAGRAIQGDYLTADRPQTLDLAAGKSMLLPSGTAIPALSPQRILTGMIDFRVDQEVRLVVAAIPEHGDPSALIPLYGVVPPDPEKPHLRGSFAHSDRVLVGQRPYDPRADGAVAITLADGEVDPFQEGRDATTGQSVRNLGNYGIVYRLLIPTSGIGRIRCYLNPRGGAFAGWAAVKAGQERKMIGLPSKALYFGVSTLSDFEQIAEFKAGESLWVTLSPPGASNLPVRLLLVPAP